MYDPIKKQAEAALLQSQIAIASERAWVATSNAALVTLNERDPIKVRIAYGDVGEEPAISAKTFGVPHLFTREQWTNGYALDLIKIEKDKCMQTPVLQEGFR